MTIILLCSAVVGLLMLFGVTCMIAIDTAKEVVDRDVSIRKLKRELDSAATELEELRCEYERSMGGQSWRFRPVNRISRRYPR